MNSAVDKRENISVPSKLSLAYYSRTRQTERFMEKVLEQIQIDVHRIKDEPLEINNSYVLITPTYDFGEVPAPVETFLENETNQNNLIAVMSSGNRNWGTNFAIAGDTISKRFNVELIGKYELAGNMVDVNKLVDYIKGRVM
ncbi:phage protein NrdI [Staphylococcus aureus]|uniref:Phage protein NrdI n=3 Tax=Staphylococcus aureus TaxID=1280 RepID=A0A6D2GUH3_STAAU|nr:MULTISPECIES: class Ib ribonucleoside-diphosphate reductase assembly flavoprotein NrdI [Staphylococcus]AGY90159.1 Ribonucleotide reduction protein NrdI [Staphylococcus aureus subsp. aureus Z172]AID40593.1 Ribonucleotide reduction protein NrdI [Staphylococcus aureus]EOR40430.1 hypothetical protein MRGR3_1197 [Staphylococcus aureus subsp. aureus MRGR3]EUR05571.1 nrdI protein [Staphylococcus aureus UCIM6015]EVC23874.1 nrdI protein [Staphylococcus aureus SJOS6053]